MRHFNPHLPVRSFHLYSLLSVSSLPSWCILILMAVRCKFTERDVEGKRETGERQGERARERTGGWRMDGGRRRRGEINMALIVSSASPPSLHQPFITPPQSVQHRHFGKWGLPLIPSAKTAATYVGVRSRVEDRSCVCRCSSEWTLVTHEEMMAWWVCLSSWWSKENNKKKWIKKHPNTFFIFFSFGATPSISCAKSNGKIISEDFSVLCWCRYAHIVWKASRRGILSPNHGTVKQGLKAYCFY